MSDNGTIVLDGLIISGGGGVEEAPEDGKAYNRKNAGWVEAQSGSGGGNIYASEVLKETSLQGYWRLNENYGATTLADASGKGINATSANPAQLLPAFGFLPNDSNRAMRFMNTSYSYASFTPAKFADGDFSIVLLMNARTVVPSYGYFFQAYNGGTYNGFQKSISLGLAQTAVSDMKLCLQMADNGIGSIVNCGLSFPLPINVPFFVTATFKAPVFNEGGSLVTPGQMKLYLNGCLMDTKEYNYAMPSVVRDNHSFGGGASTSDFVGELDEISIFSSCLTPERIAQLYRYSQGGAKED